MTVQHLIVGIILLLATYESVVGQTPPRPEPPSFPPAQTTRPIFAPREPSSLHRTAQRQAARPQLTELAPPPQVRIPSNNRVPNQGELVSILKRKLPRQNQTIQVKDAPEWFQTMMQRIVRENVPQKYVQDKDWGKTEKRWAGVKVQRKGMMNWYTKRQWKDVNHGTWKRYEVTQIDPNENLKMRIENVRDAGAGKVGFEVALKSRLHVHGRMANWAKGIQMYNISADANAAVEMRIWCQVGMTMDLRKFPPDVILLPEVTQADLNVTDFQLQRVSKLKGPMVQQLSGSVHKILLDKIQEKRNGLPNKINRQIAKNQDKMRLSLSDFASSKWESLTSGTSEVESADEIPQPPGVTMRGSAALTAEAARARAAQLEAARIEAARVEAARLEAARQEAARIELARKEAARVAAAKAEAARVEAARLEAARVEAARLQAARVEAARLQAAKAAAERERTIAELRRQEANRGLSPLVANPTGSTTGAMRSILVRPGMRASTRTLTVSEPNVEPEFVPAADPVAERIGSDTGPEVELFDFVPLSERAMEL